MPIFEYECAACGQRFERLVFGDHKTQCPACKSWDVKKRPSLFGMSGVKSQTSSCSSCSSSSCASCK
ncbi:MAG: zinc ribbon domain-containing protein [Nitrospirae bacterium]|nr:zinc ribbon domain-containing protein [Nitrospirota bacterium]